MCKGSQSAQPRRRATPRPPWRACGRSPRAPRRLIRVLKWRPIARDVHSKAYHREFAASDSRTTGAPRDCARERARKYERVAAAGALGTQQMTVARTFHQELGIARILA